MSNYDKLQGSSLDEVAEQLVDGLSARVGEISDSNATIVFRNGSVSVYLDWSEANKEFIKNSIKNWLESDGNEIKIVEPDKEVEECVTSQ